MIRNNEGRLNRAVAKLTGITTIFCTSIPMALPSVAITPVTRQRLSPTLNHWPKALFLPKSSDSTSLPITHTGGDRSRVTPGKKLPLSISHFLTAKKEGVVPIMGTDRSKPLN